MSGWFPTYIVLLVLAVVYGQEPVHSRIDPVVHKIAEAGWDWLLNQWCKAMRHAADPRYSYEPRHL